MYFLPILSPKESSLQRLAILNCYHSCCSRVLLRSRYPGMISPRMGTIFTFMKMGLGDKLNNMLIKWEKWNPISQVDITVTSGTCRQVVEHPFIKNRRGLKKSCISCWFVYRFLMFPQPQFYRISCNMHMLTSRRKKKHNTRTKKPFNAMEAPVTGASAWQRHCWF